jgi:hypothetical protein
MSYGEPKTRQEKGKGKKKQRDTPYTQKGVRASVERSENPSKKEPSKKKK